MNKNLIVSLALVGASSVAQSAVFVGAHADDIELFMSQNMLGDLRGQAPTVFIVGTAGDAGAGKGEGSNIYSNSYGAVRSAAHVAAVRFAMSQSGARVPQTVASTESMGGKTINVLTVGNVKFYNLMLPDGNFGGTGYPSTGNQSLSYLNTGRISTITSLDNLNTRYTLPELRATLRDIVTKNMRGIPTVWVNLQDDASGTNPSDHSDHTTLSRITQDALASNTCVHRALFVDYDTANRPVNLNANQINDGFAVFGTLNAYLVNQGNPSTYDGGHTQWLSRQYYRTVHGTGSCNF